MKTFELTFSLREQGTNSFGRQLNVQINEDGRAIGCWIDGEPVTGAIEINELITRLIGRAYSQRRFIQLAAVEHLMKSEGA